MVNPEDVGKSFLKNVDSNYIPNSKLHDIFLKMEAADSTEMLVTYTRLQQKQSVSEE
jgi:hypothetical protein